MVVYFTPGPPARSTPNNFGNGSFFLNFIYLTRTSLRFPSRRDHAGCVGENFFDVLALWQNITMFAQSLLIIWRVPVRVKIRLDCLLCGTCRFWFLIRCSRFQSLAFFLFFASSLITFVGYFCQANKSFNFEVFSSKSYLFEHTHLDVCAWE